ncbi:unnamed protein product [Schistosoma curassoni]|uniref:Reverse transcriptase domain-containing protein n=1 Tax=Schistosoma curassoni TaxID=6186 RepID=A0A183KNS0_9TREM|nr:unnamed protein product [Schistosoma curassoni]
MWDTGRAFQIAAEMRSYNLEVLGISETRWTQVGQQRLTSGELLLYSGHEEENAPHTQGVTGVKSKEGKVITNIEEQRNRWVEHFKELLNRPAPLNPSNIEAAHTDLPINVGPPTIEEITMTIRQIKSGKAAGPGNILTEALKRDVATSARILHILFNKIWDEKQVPKDWKEGLLIKIPKKGDLSNCDNYRGITFLSIPGSVQ